MIVKDLSPVETEQYPSVYSHQTLFITPIYFNSSDIQNISWIIYGECNQMEHQK